MDTLGFAEITIGHNKPPSGVSDGVIREALEQGNEALCDRRNQLLGAEERLPQIAGDADAGKVSDYIKQITAALKAADGARIAAKEPFLAGGRVVDGFFVKGIGDPLSALKRRVEGKLTRYLQDKAAQEREDRLEAERRARAAEEDARKQAVDAAAKASTERELDAAIAAEAKALDATVTRIVAEAAADAKPAALSRTRGDFGSVASLRTTWEYEVTDLASIPRLYLMVNDAALKAHIKARLKNQPPGAVAGARFYEKTSAAVR